MPNEIPEDQVNNIVEELPPFMVGLMGGMVIKDTIQESLAIHAVRCQDAEPTPLER